MVNGLVILALLRFLILSLVFNFISSPLPTKWGNFFSTFALTIVNTFYNTFNYRLTLILLKNDYLCTDKIIINLLKF